MTNKQVTTKRKLNTNRVLMLVMIVLMVIVGVAQIKNSLDNRSELRELNLKVELLEKNEAVLNENIRLKDEIIEKYQYYIGRQRMCSLDVVDCYEE